MRISDWSSDVCSSDLPFAPGDGTLLLLDRPVAQHQVREIQVELVRRHVGTFGQEAHVAERAGVDHRLEAGAVHGVELAALRPVDQVEQPREAVAQVEAAPAAVADFADPPHRSEEHPSELQSLMRIPYAV